MPRFKIRSAPFSIRANGVDAAQPTVLRCAYSASLSPTSAVTLEMWVKPRIHKAMQIFDNSTLGATNSYWYLMNADGGIAWYSTIGGVAKNQTVSTATKMKIGQWNFVQATYNGANVLFFINGVQCAETISATGSLGANESPRPLNIGAYYSGGISITFDGWLYRPRVYSVGCSLAEHQNLYYNDIMSTALSAGRVLDLAMTEGSGSSIADSSGQSNTATVGSSASWSTDVPFSLRGAATGRVAASGRVLASGRVTP